MPEFSVIKCTGIKPVALDKIHLLRFDGGAVPNPGKAGGGSILYKNADCKETIFERAEYLGTATNNQAEYWGLIIGLMESSKRGIQEILIEGDSQLVIFQVQGTWKIKNDELRNLHKRVAILLKSFSFVGIRHIYRDSNTDADRIATEGIADEASFIRD